MAGCLAAGRELTASLSASGGAGGDSVVAGDELAEVGEETSAQTTAENDEHRRELLPPSGEKVALDVELTNIVNTGDPLASVRQPRLFEPVGIDITPRLQPGIGRDDSPVITQGPAPDAVPNLIDHLRSARGAFDHLVTLPIPVVPTGSAQHEVKQPFVATTHDTFRPFTQATSALRRYPRLGILLAPRRGDLPGAKPSHGR